MPDFTDILSKKIEDVTKPPTLPAGTYRAVVQGMPAQNERTVQGEQRKLLTFKVKLQSPGPDVDSDKIAEFGDLSSAPPQSIDFWIDDAGGEFKLRQFLEETLQVSGKTFGEAIAQSPGKPLNVGVVHEPYIDKSQQPQIAARVRSWASV